MSRLYKVITWAELWLVAGAVLAGMIWAPVLIAAPIVGLVYAILRLGVDRRFSRPTPAELPILLLILLLPISYIILAIPEQTTEHIFRLLGGIALYYAVVNWGTIDNRLRWLAAFTGLAALGLSLLSFFTVTWTWSKLLFIPLSVYERFSHAINDAIHPNVMGGTLAALLPMTLAIPFFAWRKISWVERLVYLVIFIGTSATLVLTQSRGALLALAGALMIVLLLKSLWFWFLPIGGLLLGVIALIIVGPDILGSYITDLFTVEGLGQRTDIWQRTLYMLQDFPLTGVGMGNYSTVFGIFYPMSLDPSSQMPHAHNIFLQVGAELGIPGLIFWLSILIVSLVSAWQVYRAGKLSNQPLIIAIGAGLLGCLLVVIFHGMIDCVLWGERRTAPLVWWLFSMAAAGLNFVVAEKRARLVPGTTTSG